MVVDQLEKGHINIKDLVLPEAKEQKGFNFDPRRDLTPADWKWILSYFEESRKESQAKIPADFLPLASNIAIIDPEKHPERLIKEEEWGAIKNSIQGARGLKHWGDFADRAAALKLLDKDRFAQIHISTKDYLAIDWAVKQAWFNLSPLTPRDIRFAGFARDFKILAPDYPLPNEDEKVWGEMMKSLSYYEDRKHWDVVSTLLADMRVLLPSNFSELHIKRETIDGIKGTFASFYQDRDITKYAFTRWARELKILSAKDVKVTNQGLEISMPEENQVIEEGPNLPKTRKF